MPTPMRLGCVNLDERYRRQNKVLVNQMAVLMEALARLVAALATFMIAFRRCRRKAMAR